MLRAEMRNGHADLFPLRIQKEQPAKEASGGDHQEARVDLSVEVQAENAAENQAQSAAQEESRVQTDVEDYIAAQRDRVAAQQKHHKKQEQGQAKRDASVHRIVIVNNPGRLRLPDLGNQAQH